jgi:predicted nucleic acid-binding protein
MDRIYLDACCLNRPFDDQTQERIRLESEAIVFILNFVQRHLAEWIGSTVLNFELGQIPDPERRRRVIALSQFVTSSVDPEVRDFARAQELQGFGFKAVDALHVACAEKAGCSVLFTTDDPMLRAGIRNADRLRVRLANPAEYWLREVKPA